MNSYIDLNIEVFKKAENARFGNRNDIRLVDLGPIALFSFFKLTISSGKHLEDISHAHINFLMNKLLTTSKSSDDLFFGFYRDRGRRQQELTNNKNIKGQYHVKICSKMFLVLLTE